MTTSDATKHEQLLKDLERAHGDLQSILDHFPGFIFYKDTRNVILRVNQAMAQSLGLSPEEMAGRHARDFYPKLADSYYEDDLEVIRSGRPKLGIIEPVDLEAGKRAWFETNKIPIMNEDGKVTGILGIAVDVTVRVQVREERERLIQELAEELDSFTYTISHDLKTPVASLPEDLTTERECLVSQQSRQVDPLYNEFLTKTLHELRTPLHGISGLAESLLTGSGDNLTEAMRADLSMIAANSRRLSGMVGHLLDFTRLREGRLDLSFRPGGVTGVPGKHTLLVVDDEPVNRRILVHQLSNGGYRTVEAANGEEALECLEKESFDLVLLDVMMPRLSGYETCRRIRQRFPLQELPVIFLTALGQTSDRLNGLAVGGNDYLAKPISKEELLSRVRTHLELLDAHRALADAVSEKTEEVRILAGLLPICMSCKRIRDDQERWHQLETYIDAHSEAKFSHGLCPECLPKLYPEHTLE